MLNIANDSSVSMPLVPRSMTRDSPPVLRSRWKRSDSVWTCAKVETATSRMRVILHLGEDAVAQLRESLHQDARGGVGAIQDERQRRARSRPASLRQHVDRPAVEQRRDAGRRRREQQEERSTRRRARAAPAAPSARDRAAASTAAGTTARHHPPRPPARAISVPHDSAAEDEISRDSRGDWR